MGELVELNRKHDNLTVAEVLGLAKREDFGEVMVIGLKNRDITVWVSEMEDDHAHWLASKAALAILKIS